MAHLEEALTKPMESISDADVRYILNNFEKKVRQFD